MFHIPLATSLVCCGNAKGYQPFADRHLIQATRWLSLQTFFRQMLKHEEYLVECQANLLPDRRKRHTVPDKIRYATLLACKSESRQ